VAAVSANLDIACLEAANLNVAWHGDGASTEEGNGLNNGELHFEKSCLTVWERFGSLVF
jgi:hypothetical protein